MRYFKAALRKKVIHSDEHEGTITDSWTEIRPISVNYVTSGMAWQHAAMEAVNLSETEGLPLEWIQEIDQYEWETL